MKSFKGNSERDKGENHRMRRRMWKREVVGERECKRLRKRVRVGESARVHEWERKIH